MDASSTSDHPALKKKGLRPASEDDFAASQPDHPALQGTSQNLQRWRNPSFLIREEALRQRITDLGLTSFFRPPSRRGALQESLGMLQLFEALLPELMMKGDAASLIERWNKREFASYPFRGSSPQKRMEILLQWKG